MVEISGRVESAIYIRLLIKNWSLFISFCRTNRISTMICLFVNSPHCGADLVGREDY